MKEVTKDLCSSCLVFDEYKNKGQAGKIGIVLDRLLIAADIDPAQRAELKKVIAVSLYLEAEDQATALLEPSTFSKLAN